MRKSAMCIMAIVLMIGFTGCVHTNLDNIGWLDRLLIDWKDARCGVPSFKDVETLGAVVSPSTLVQPEGEIKDEIPEGMEVVYLDTDISKWTITQRLGIRHIIERNQIIYFSADASKAQKLGQGWKEVSGSIGNFWVGIPGEYIGRDTNKIYATTWEWLTKNRNPRTRNHLGGGIAKKPHVIPTQWMPQVSNILYHATSGVARGPIGGTGTRERTQWLKDKPWE